jgi:acetyltransferase-like isoleucine patch superfamily enzyme
MSKIRSKKLPNQQMRMHLQTNFMGKFNRIWQMLRGVHLGRNVIIDKGVKFFRYPKNIYISEEAILKQSCQLCPCRKEAAITVGARTTIGFYTLIYATSEITIGQDCMIAPFVYIVDSDHGLRRGELMNRQPNRPEAVRIEDDVWVGAHSVILKGVHVEYGAVIASGAVVRENVPAYAIVGGVPAKVIGERT